MTVLFIIGIALMALGVIGIVYSISESIEKRRWKKYVENTLHCDFDKERRRRWRTQCEIERIGLLKSYKPMNFKHDYKGGKNEVHN